MRITKNNNIKLNRHKTVPINTLIKTLEFGIQYTEGAILKHQTHNQKEAKKLKKYII